MRSPDRWIPCVLVRADARADRDSDTFADIREGCRFHEEPDLLRDLLSGFQVAIKKDHAKLFPPIAGYDVACTGSFCQTARDPDQDLIALLMAVGVVDFFEPVKCRS